MWAHDFTQMQRYMHSEEVRGAATRQNIARRRHFEAIFKKSIFFEKIEKNSIFFLYRRFHREGH